jgi:hypothetical protein
MKTITISTQGILMSAELNDSSSAQQIWDALPLEGSASTWGDEIYFATSVVMEEEPDASADVEVGDLGYWPPGHALCIFFGPTPASTAKKPRAASPVNILGHVMGDARQFRIVQNGTTVRVDRSEKVQP